MNLRHRSFCAGRGRATGCGAYAAPRSAGLVARARSAPRELTRCGCLSGANASSHSEFRNGAARLSTGGHPACKAGRCIRSRRRWPARGPALTLEGRSQKLTPQPMNAKPNETASQEVA
jgi:hypothetical protein